MAISNEDVVGKVCSNCGRTDDKLKRCTACKLVFYCNVDCQRSHRKSHKQECKRRSVIIRRIGAENNDDACNNDASTQRVLNTPSNNGKTSSSSFDNVDVDEKTTKNDEKQHTGKLVEKTINIADLLKTVDWTQRQECPICTLTIQDDDGTKSYMSCCGKTICVGCTVESMRTEMALQRNRGSSSIASPHCCFCRAPTPKSNAETTAQLNKRIQQHHDPLAMEVLAGRYMDGMGVPKDERKAFELLKRSANIGRPSAAWMTGQYYNGLFGNVVPMDINEAKRLYTSAANCGHSLARNRLGEMEVEEGNALIAKNHFIIAAASGNDSSLDHLKMGYKQGFVSKEELAASLRAHQAAKENLDSDIRTKNKIDENAHEVIRARAKREEENRKEYS